MKTHHASFEVENGIIVLYSFLFGVYFEPLDGGSSPYFPLVVCMCVCVCVCERERDLVEQQNTMKKKNDLSIESVIQRGLYHHAEVRTSAMINSLNAQSGPNTICQHSDPLDPEMEGWETE